MAGRTPDCIHRLASSRAHAGRGRAWWSPTAALVVPLLWVLAGSPLSASAASPSQQDRAPLAGRTLVVSRAQLKYPLYGDYTRRWLDRPLFQDRALRTSDEPTYYINFASFARMVQIARQYELDGFAFFPGVRSLPATADEAQPSIYKLADRACGDGFSLLTEFLAGETDDDYHRHLAAALASKTATRLGGKLLVTSYSADGKPPEQWKRVLDSLRAKHGDNFFFLPDVSPGSRLLPCVAQFNAGQPIADADLQAMKARLRSYLDVCDGIYYAHSGMLRTADRKFNVRFYREFLIPLYQSVLAEPAYKSKYFGLSASIGYFLPESGSTLSESGTKTLRSSLETALAANPDVINLPEWDEVNENTNIRPTVFNSLSTQRILRHYMRRLKGLPLAPLPGDDTSIPNLIVSYRKLLVFGESLEIELLNVPDSDRRGTYSVTVTLKDLAGRVVKQFPPQTLPTQDLADRTLVIPSETMAPHAVLIPSLSIRAGDRQYEVDDGLHYVALRTWNWDEKWVKQPLRDLCRPKSAHFALGEETEPGARLATGEFAADEKLASLEVLENDDLIYAADAQDEYLRSRSDVVLLRVERRALRRSRLIGTIRVEGAECHWLGEELRDGTRRDESVKDHVLRFNANVDRYARSNYVAIRKADVDKATLVFDSNQIKARVSVRQIIDNAVYAETHDDGLSLTVTRYCKQPAHPYHLQQESVRFSAPVRPEMSASVFHMRAITEKGRFYYSRPVAPGLADPASRLSPARVFSDTAKEPVQVQLAPVSIPDVAYDFVPQRGSVLATRAGRPFWAVLGGFSDTATGRSGSGDGAGTPFREGARNYPATAKKTAPDWVTADGTPCLKFDGSGTYLLLPLETLPRRSGFTLSFDIKPASSKPQVLFNCQSHYAGSLTVGLQEGHLTGAYATQYQRTQRLDPRLPVELGQWSTIEVLYDQTTIRFRVNGKESESLACPGPGLYIGMSVFGGFGDEKSADKGKSGWFDGELRSPRIRHACP